MLLANDERDHTRPRLALLERPLGTDPAESRDRPVGVNDEHERLRLLAKSLEPDRCLLFAGRVAELAQQRRYRGRVVRASFPDLHAVTLTKQVREVPPMSVPREKISVLRRA